MIAWSEPASTAPAAASNVSAAARRAGTEGRAAVVAGGGRLAGGGLGGAAEVGEARIFHPAVEQHLLARPARNFHRRFHRQACSGQEARVVVLAEGLLALLLVKLEEPALSSALGEAVEGVEAVSVLPQRHLRGFKSEEAGKQGRDLGLGLIRAPGTRKAARTGSRALRRCRAPFFSPPLAPRGRAHAASSRRLETARAWAEKPS